MTKNDSSTQSAPLLDSLPRALHAKGRPLSIHRQWSDVVEDVRLNVLKFLGSNRFVSRHAFERIALFGLAIVFVSCGAAALWVYNFNPPKNEDPKHALYAAIACFVLGGGCGILGLVHIALNGRFPGQAAEGASRSSAEGQKKLSQADSERPSYYLVYQDGLAIVTGGTFSFLAWIDIAEVARTWKRLDPFTTLTMSDGRTFVIANGYSNMGELRQAIAENVNRCLLPRALKAIAQGKSVTFGPFALSRSQIVYKERPANWDDVSSMKMETYRGRTTLTLYVRGRMFHWCWHDFNDIPNNQTFYDVVCRVAPERLLVTSFRR